MTEKRSAKELQKIKDMLEARKKELQEELNSIQKEEKEVDTSQDPADQVSSLVLETLKTSLQNNEVEELQMIVKALAMLKEGIYGICQECGTTISSKRLASYPNATRCLVCQEKLEVAS